MFRVDNQQIDERPVAGSDGGGPTLVTARDTEFGRIGPTGRTEPTRLTAVDPGDRTDTPTARAAGRPVSERGRRSDHQTDPPRYA
jgi:hypothetical protein